MSRSKVIAAILVALSMICVLGISCADGWEWKERVEIAVPSNEGGGVDVTARKFATYLEKELGVPITILNKADSITSCYTYCYSAENEGYLYQLTAPTSFLVDAAGMFQGFTLRDEIIPVSGLVQAEGIFFSRTDAPWHSAKELIEYMKEHPGEVTCAVDSPTGISGAIVREFEESAGVQFEWITSSGTEGFISTIAGDIDTCINTWSDAGAYAESGDLTATLLMAPQRNSAYPDVECAEEVGVKATLGYYRAFTAMKGCPQEAVDAFGAAVKAATQDPEWIAWLATNGLTNDYVWTPEEFQAQIDATYEAAGAAK